MKLTYNHTFIIHHHDPIYFDVSYFRYLQGGEVRGDNYILSNIISLQYDGHIEVINDYCPIGI